MTEWTVELSATFVADLETWPRAAQLEIIAIHVRLSERGPEGVGLIASELEGVPPWTQLGQPMERTVPVPMDSGVWQVTMDIRPELRLIILSARHMPRH